jgi:hypothetical protein
METKKSVLMPLLAVVLWLLATCPAISQEIHNPKSLKSFRDKTEKHVPQQKDMKTFQTNRTDLQNPENWSKIGIGNKPVLKQNELWGTDGLAFHPDTIISFADTYGNFKEILLYDNNQNILSETIFDWQNNGWVNLERYSGTYDVNGNLLTVLGQVWDNNAWFNNELSTFTYDANGNELTELYQYWEGGNWVNSELTINTFDGNGNQLTRLGQLWDIGAWLNSSFSTMTYDDSGNLLTLLWQIWESEVWLNSDLWTKTYTTNGQLLTNTMVGWDGTGWGLLMYRDTFTYDEAGNMLTYTNESGDTGTWVNSYMETYTYDENGNWLTLLVQYWSGAWDNTDFVTRTYDANGKVLTNLYQYWEGAWTNASLGVFTYDGDGNQLSALYQFWDGATWANNMKVDYEYQAGLIIGNAFMWDGSGWVTGEWFVELGINDSGNYFQLFGNMASTAQAYYSSYPLKINDPEVCKPSLMAIYPNPAYGNLTISTEILHPSGATISLFDLSGRMVDVVYNGILQPGAQPVTFDPSGLTPGIYILELKTGSISERQKLTIVK